MTRFASFALAAALLSGLCISTSRAEDGADVQSADPSGTTTQSVDPSGTTTPPAQDGPNILGVQSGGTAGTTSGGNANITSDDIVRQTFEGQNGQN